MYVFFIELLCYKSQIFWYSFSCLLHIILFKPMALSLFFLLFLSHPRHPALHIIIATATYFTIPYSIDEPPSLLDKSQPSPLSIISNRFAPHPIHRMGTPNNSCTRSTYLCAFMGKSSKLRALEMSSVHPGIVS
mmetsp:Transcript_15812/g.38001  ORF Transcript_15812/g.38001 Transcript_15812/m.38001 type:complete len:134 (-) Transcript_15812:1080-1481(-)